MRNLRIVAESLASSALYGALLLVPAWAWNWGRAWVLIGAVFAALIVNRLWVFRANPALLEERRKPPMQPGQPLADKLLVVAFGIVFPAYIMFIPLDVFRFHLLAKPTLPVSLSGFALAAAGWLIVALALRANAFAAAIVKHQPDRAQVVVDSGVYGVVRHPLYSGVALIFIGIALWLESYAAALAAVIPIGVLVVRIVVEEDFLRKRLSGYEDYMTRVGDRLIPRVW